MANTSWGDLGWSAGNFGGLNDVTVQVTAPGTLTTWGSNSWGQFGWGENIGLSTLEGNTTIDIISVANVTGQLLNISLNSVTAIGTANLTLTGQQLSTTLNSVTTLIATDVSLTGQQLTSALGIVDPAPDAEVTGIQLTTTLNNAVEIDIAVAALVFGQQLTLSLGNETVDLNTPVNLTTNLSTLSLNSVIAKTDVTVNVTGFRLTGTTAQLYVSAWAPVNTGQSVNWTEVAA
jgi:alpha-tubulin suppressor-like RCC1 family protein